MSSFSLDFSYGICKRKLRSLEQLAYSSVVTSLRAQGSLTREKKRLLQELQSVLHISLPLHKAEIRRVVNCQILHTIAERTEGPNTASEWAIEGRRLCPLIPRARVETEYTRYADEVVKAYKAEIAKQIAAAEEKRHSEKASGPHEVIDLQSDSSNWTNAKTDVEEIELDIQSIMKSPIPEESVPPKKDIRSRKKGEKRKRESAEIDDGSCKIMAIVPPSEDFSLKQSYSEKAIKISSTGDSSPASKADVHCIYDNKGNSSETEMIPKSSKLRFSLPSKSLFSSTSTVYSCVTYVNPISSAPKMITTPAVTIMPNQLEMSDSALTITSTCNLSRNSLASDSTSCTTSASVVNSVANLTGLIFHVMIDDITG